MGKKSWMPAMDLNQLASRLNCVAIQPCGPLLLYRVNLLDFNIKIKGFPKNFKNLTILFFLNLNYKILYSF